MRIFVIRHAEYDSGHLTAEGKARAQWASNELDGLFSEIIHSTAQSAVDTAKAIACGCPVMMTPKAELSIWDNALGQNEELDLRKLIEETMRQEHPTLIVTHQPVLNAIEDMYALEKISDEYCCGACLEMDDGRLEVLYHIVPGEDWERCEEWRRAMSGPQACQACGRLEFNDDVDYCAECGEELIRDDPLL